MPNQLRLNSPEGNLENYFISEYWLIDQYVGDTLWSWGFNGNGFLGDNTTISRSTPVTTLAGGTNWKQVACATQHTAAIKTDGTLWTWGSNSSLGNNTSDLNNRVTPITTFAGGTDWKQVACGHTHTAAIKTDGTLWAWGSECALGNNITTKTNKSTPVTTIAGGTNWKQVACGNGFTSAIKTDGTLWTWGANNAGQLGDNTTTQRYTPVTTFAGGTNWKQVDCGRLLGTSVAAIKTDGTLWTWGFNNAGQLGDNTAIQRNTPVTTFAGGTNWKQVSCGQNHTAAIKTDGTLWVCGNNGSGKLGNNTIIVQSTPVTTFAGGTNWKQVGVGADHTVAIKTDGTLWIWGSNGVGRLGDNTAITKSTPVTTFAGGSNWKQVSSAYQTVAVTSGTDPTFFIT